jgi:hypothetical protein
LTEARLFLVLICLLMRTVPAMAAGCAVELDGKTVPVRCVSPAGTPDVPTAGNLVRIDDVWVRLDSPRPLKLRTVRRPWGRLLVAGETSRVVAVCVDEPCPTDPLAELTDIQSRALLGLYVRHPVADLPAVLARIDRKRCAVTLVDFVAEGPQKAVPRLPDDLDSLALVCCVTDGFAEFSSLSRLTELRVLIATRMDVPCSVLGRMRSLRALRAHIAGFDPLLIGDLRELRSLEMPYHRSVSDLAFVRGLTKLRALDISWTSVTEVSQLADHPSLSRLSIRGTRVKSLRPLSGHPTLRRVRARHSQLALLPDGKPGALEFVDALGTKVSDAEAASYRKSHIGCRLFCRLMDPLREAVKSANRLRLRTGGMCCGVDGARERTLWETRDGPETRAFIRALDPVEPDPDEGGGHCACCGSVTIEFWHDGRLLAGISVHHGASLRWDGWGDDVDLTERGAKALRAWVKARVMGQLEWD